MLSAQGVSIKQEGINPPTMSIAERDTISNPADGMLVFVTDDNSFYFYNGFAWAILSSGWATNGNNMSNTNSGNVGIGNSSPTQKLDVAGTIKGISFQGNGSTLTFGANSNMQPSLGINYIIALYGIYPSPSKSVEGIEPYIGEVTMFAGNFAPQGWAFCDGQLLSIASNTALFSILGTTYGGNGFSTFALPDLRGRVPMHKGTGPGLTPRNLGQNVGVEIVGQ